MEQRLTKLKNIHPSEDFKQRSKQLILSMPQLEETPRPLIGWVLNNLQYKTAFTVALSGIFMILSGLSLLYKNPSAMADSLDQKQLAKEAQSLEIKIQLSQAQYYEESAKKIEIALNQTSDEKN